jgi:RNA polymerase sigma factor (sigma-70 family)
MMEAAELFRPLAHPSVMRLPQRNDSRAPTDGELVTAARRGDGAALGLLLERHRPHLLARALRLLGYRPDAEDAVQETCLAAMRHLGAVRDPEAVGAWLHAVLRRACLQQRRRARRLTSEPELPELPEVVDPGAGPEARIERLELREWIWGALETLPEPLRVTAMLRYFGSYDAYDELAAILGVPIGTVRSRLAEARRRLADALLASAALLDDDGLTRRRLRAAFWADAFRDIVRRGDGDRFITHFDDDLLVAWSNGRTLRGRGHLAAEIEGDLAAGVRLEPERVLASDGVAVVEGRFVNPPGSPDHCPPGIALVLFGRDERASRIHLHLAPRIPRADGD